MILTFVIRDKLNTSYEFWEQWIEGAKQIYSLINIEPTNCSVSTLGKEGGLLKYKSLEKKMERTKAEKKLIDNISFWTLPDDYTSIVFDFIVDLESIDGITFLSLNEEYMSVDNLNENKIVDILKKMVPDGKGEIYFMDNDEAPGTYALNWNTPGFYKTLKVIRQF